MVGIEYCHMTPEKVYTCDLCDLDIIMTSTYQPFCASCFVEYTGLAAYTYFAHRLNLLMYTVPASV